MDQAPLLAPAPALTGEEVLRYSRHILLPEIGELGQRRLKAARVLVIGAGGLGCPSLAYLAAAGVGTIAVIDDDVVEASNLQRQVLFTTADLGTPKVEAAARALRGINPLITVVPIQERLTEANAVDLFTQYDLVLDGTDNFPTRYLVADAATASGVPVLWCSVLGFDFQMSLFWSAPPAGAAVTLRDLFPAPPAPGTVPSCAEAGVVGALVGQAGAAMAAEAVKMIVGVGQSLLGRVLVFDQLRTRWAEIPLRRRADAVTTEQATGGSAAGLRGAAAGPVEAAATAPIPGPSVLDPAVEGVAGGAPAPTTATPSGPPLITDLADAPDGAWLLDVREPFEVADGAIPGAIHQPLARALTELGRAELLAAGGSRERPVVVYCKVGPRAERAAAALRADGFDAWVYWGGWDRWSAEHGVGVA